MPTDSTSLPPVVRYRALCIDCIDPVRAIEIHVYPGGVYGYCAHCAPESRPWADRVLSIVDAWRERVTVTA